MESRKIILTNLFAAQQWKCRHREPTCGHSWGREGGMDWKSNTETYTLQYVKQIAGEKLLHNTGSPAWHSVITWRGRVGGGKRLKKGEIHIQL